MRAQRKRDKQKLKSNLICSVETKLEEIKKEKEMDNDVTYMKQRKILREKR